MKTIPPLLQIELNFIDYKFALICFITAFVVAMVSIPPVIMLVNRYRLHDLPGTRKEHFAPTPTLGGIAIMAGMMVSLFFWFPFPVTGEIMMCSLAIAILFAMGITDDLKDLSAKYKFIVEIALATLIALSGIRITTFGGLFGLNELTVPAQYTFTILAIVGITNAFNLIDGIDGLAGGLSFMSLVTLGIFLTMSGDKSFALIAFALAGSVLAFLYFNMNPAKIFMGDTGSLVLGFVIAILCTRLIQVNSIAIQPLLKTAPLFALGMVLIPVFDAIRVFALRIWRGQSPFNPDRTHIHHLLTNAGFSHGLTSKIICVIHGFILIEVYWLKQSRPEFILCMLVAAMILVTIVFYNIHRLKKQKRMNGEAGEYELS
ncbi:MAG TPA: MraY family glycosyltransferase [Chitinophagaceae bacterium]|jgi:UDP-N-acetylmuramyl pentapeptide phosphotransferase/UDP-N-acetylglucosamine-1-phosphate transferase|nr:MraY family glycosyltransferase [Chitinophagaceae bacterium]